MFLLPNYKAFVKKPPDKSENMQIKNPVIDNEGFQTVLPKKRKKKAPIGEKRKKSESSNASMDESENIYEPLGDDSDGDEMPPKPKPPKEIAPPPITIPDMNISQVFGECNKLTLTKNNVKFIITNDGIKIYCRLVEEFQKIQTHLLTSSIKFYTHMLKNQKQTKIVLYGLPNMEIASIRAKMLEHNLEPAEIKMLNIRNPRYTDQCHYLIYFDRSKNIKISDVREIKSMFHLGVKWEYFSKRNLGPTQCGNCFKFGHGSRDCHLPPNCIKCGQSHRSVDCIFNLPAKSADEKPRIPQNKIKCVNCSGGHTANFSGCPARDQYLARIGQLRKRSSVMRTNSRNEFRNAPELNDFNYPSLPNGRSANHTTNRHQQ